MMQKVRRKQAKMTVADLAHLKRLSIDQKEQNYHGDSLNEQLCPHAKYCTKR